MEERTVNEELIVTVRTEEEFLAALTHWPEVDGLAIEAPEGLAQSLGFDAAAPEDA